MPGNSTHHTNSSSRRVDISTDVDMLKAEETAQGPSIPPSKNVSVPPEIDMLRSEKTANHPKKQTLGLRAYTEKSIGHVTSASAPPSKSLTFNPTDLFPASQNRTASHLISSIQTSNSSVSTPTSQTDQENAAKEERKAARQREQDKREVRRANALQQGKKRVAYEKITPTEPVSLEPVKTDEADLDFLTDRLAGLLVQEKKQRKAEEGKEEEKAFPEEVVDRKG